MQIEARPGQPQLRRAGGAAGRHAGERIVRQARQTLEALEAQSRTGDAQVDLFAAPPAPLQAPEPSRVEAALARVDPDTTDAARSARRAVSALKKLLTSFRT